MNINIDMRYPFTITPDKPEGYLVEFIDIPEAFTCGDTIEECIFNAQEVLTIILESRLAADREIPEPSKSDSPYRTAPSASVQASILIRKFREGKTLSELARALNTSWPAAKRLEDPKHTPTLRQLERALNALGKQLILSVAD